MIRGPWRGRRRFLCKKSVSSAKLLRRREIDGKGAGDMGGRYAEEQRYVPCFCSRVAPAAGASGWGGRPWRGEACFVVDASGTHFLSAGSRHHHNLVAARPGSTQKGRHRHRAIGRHTSRTAPGKSASQSCRLARPLAGPVTDNCLADAPSTNCAGVGPAHRVRCRTTPAGRPATGLHAGILHRQEDSR